MYTTSQQVLKRLQGLGQGADIGAVAGTAIAPGIGTAVGGFVGSLFGRRGAPQNPGGPAAFARWAQAGRFDWVASVALTMSGPDWSRDPNDTGQPWKTGYSPADAMSAVQVLAQYGLTPQTARNRVATPGAGVPASEAAPRTFTSGGTTSLASGVQALTASPVLLVALAAGLLVLSRPRRR